MNKYVQNVRVFNFKRERERERVCECEGEGQVRDGREGGG